MSGSFARDMVPETAGEELDAGAAAAQLSGDAMQEPVSDGTAAGLPAELDADVGRYRELVSRLLFDGASSERAVLAVTSTASGEGVTWSAAAAALALARSTSGRVLLLDANLRRPAVHDLFGVTDRPGLLQVIEECSEGVPAVASAAWASAPYTRETPVGNLWLMPAGGIVEDPTRLLTSDVAALALRFVTAHFDYTVVDCPPLLTAVDSVALCRLATSVVVVVQAGRTPRENVQRVCERLRGFPLMGVLLNGVDGANG